ncbi:MAG: four helix bundle protein [Planctomycetota bacterium]
MAEREAFEWMEAMAVRTREFAVRCLRLCDALPKRSVGHAVSGQLSRSGTSVGANFRAARRARSKKEYAAKLFITREEADETVYWLEIIEHADLLPKHRIEALQQGAEELLKIINKLIQNTRRN